MQQQSQMQQQKPNAGHHAGPDIGKAPVCATLCRVTKHEAQQRYVGVAAKQQTQQRKKTKPLSNLFFAPTFLDVSGGVDFSRGSKGSIVGNFGRLDLGDRTYILVMSWLVPVGPD